MNLITENNGRFVFVCAKYFFIYFWSTFKFLEIWKKHETEARKEIESILNKVFDEQKKHLQNVSEDGQENLRDFMVDLNERLKAC